LIYFLVYAALLLCGFLSRGKHSLRNSLYYVCLLGLFVFVGFRYKVGCDWAGYFFIFQDASRLEWANMAEQPEAAFWAANKLLQDFEFEYPYINLIASTGFFLGLHVLAKRQPDPLSILILAFPVLILNLAMSGLRQAIAMGLLCFAYNAFVDKRLVRYILFVVLGAAFHKSAIFLLALTPFVRAEYSPKRMALAGLLALPGAYFLLTGQSFEFYAHRYVGAEAPEAAGAPFRAGLLALTGIVFWWFLDRKWKVRFVRDYKLVKLFSYMLIAMFPIALFSSVIGDRFGYYLCPIQLIILGRLPMLVQGKHSVLIAFAPYAAGALVLVVWIELSSLFEKCYLPYQMW
jgi:hypothetical protein